MKQREKKKKTERCCRKMAFCGLQCQPEYFCVSFFQMVYVRKRTVGANLCSPLPEKRLGSVTGEGGGIRGGSEVMKSTKKTPKPPKRIEMAV